MVGRLDAFGRGGDVGTAAKAGDRAHDRDAIGALDKVLHERAVDLDLVERKTAEWRERYADAANMTALNRAMVSAH